MEENLWRIVQVIMWVLALQATILIALIGAMWSSILKRFEKVEEKFNKIDQRFDKVDQRFEKVDQRFDKIDTELHDIDKRLFAVETMLHMKDCCMLKDERLKNVEGS